MKTIEFDEQCPSCKGTGLYSGMAERDGLAVVCSTCKGTGCHHFTYKYEDFTGRVEDTTIIRVVETNPGIVIGLGKQKGIPVNAFGGMPYEDWKSGSPFPPKSEMRNYTCPAWWYQSADYEKKPRLKECWDTLGSTFSKCPHFASKWLCWERFDKENV